MPKLTIGTKLCQCAACKEFFTTPSNFDLHRVLTMPPKGVARRASDTRCVDPASLRDKHGKAVFRKNAKGFWAKTGGIYMGPTK